MDFNLLLQTPQLISVVKRVYISDADGYFVDFSDRTEQKGTNRLISFGSIDTSVDKIFRHFYNKTGSVVLRNNDRFFDKCFPSTLKRQDGITAANFRKSTNNITNIFASKDYPIRVRLASEIQLAGFQPVEFVLGTFLFTAIKTSLGSTAEITTDSMVKILQKKKAENIKDGFNNWYRDVPVAFLIREILKLAFGVYNPVTYQTVIPSGFVLPQFKDLTLGFPTSQFASLGRSPNQIDTNADGEPDYFPNYGLIPRAMSYNSSDKMLYCGLDNEIWKLNTDKTSTGYMLWALHSSLAESRYIEKLQWINSKLFIWSRDKWLHSGIDESIEADTQLMDVDDLQLRQKNEKLEIYDAGGNISVYDENVYDTEFNYFPSILADHRILSVKYGGSMFYYKAYSVLAEFSFFGNINWREVQPLSESGSYSDNKLPQLLTCYEIDYAPYCFKADDANGIIWTKEVIFPTDTLVPYLTGLNDYVWEDATKEELLDAHANAEQKLNNVNLPIPFKQRVYVNCLGRKEDDSWDSYLSQYSSLQFIRTIDYNTQHLDPWNNIIDYENTSGIKNVNLKTMPYTLVSGYYAGIGTRYIATSDVTTTYFISRRAAIDPEIYDNQDIKFTLGQKGVYGLFLNAADEVLQLRVEVKSYKTYRQKLIALNYPLISGAVSSELNYIKYLDSKTVAVAKEVGVSPGYTNLDSTCAFPTIKLEKINTTTGALTTILTVEKLSYKGMEFQPTCFSSLVNTDNYLYLFGYGVDNFESKSAAFNGTTDRTSANTDHLAGIAIEESTGNIKARQHYGLILKLKSESFTSIAISSSAINTKIINYDDHYFVVDDSDLATHCPVGSILQVNNGSELWTVYVDAISQDGSTGYIHYRRWGRESSAPTVAGASFLPYGDFKSTTAYVIGNFVTPLTNQVVLESFVYSGRVYATILNLDKIGTATQYSLAWMDATTPAGFTVLFNFSNQPKNYQLGASGKVYFTLEGSGQASYIDISSGNDTTIYNSYQPLADGDMAISGEPYTHGDTALIEDNGEQAVLYGFSSPSGRDRTQASVIGKFNTWKLGADYIPLVELADFSGMSCDEALDSLTQAIYWTKGFDEFGNYFQLKRTLETEPSIIIEADKNNKFISIEKEIDNSSVANRITIIPYTTVLQPVKYAITQSARLPNDGLNLTVNIEQKDTLSKTIVLNCVRDGAISFDHYIFPLEGGEQYSFSLALASENIDTCPLFSYNVANSTTEGKLCVDANSSATVLYLNSVFGGEDIETGIHINDYAVITDSTNKTYIRKIIAVTIATNSIEVESTFGFELKATTILKFYRVNQAYKSSEYVTKTSAVTSNKYIPVDSNSQLGINNIVEFVMTGNPRALIIDKYTTSLGQDYIVLDEAVTGTILQDTVVKAYWSPMISGKMYPIGGSNVEMSLTTAKDASTEAPMPYSFVVGEAIVVTCDGLKLEQDTYSTVTYIDVESSSIYGESEFQQNVNNKFVNRTLAKYLTKAIIDDWSTPRYNLNCKFPYLPNMTIMSDNKSYLRKVRIISEDLFSTHLDFAVDFGITDLKQQPDKRSTIATLIGNNKL